MYQKSTPKSIQKMFSSIAAHYDRANTTFSFGLHKIWNRRLIQVIGHVDTLLDLCSGTGEIGLGFLAKNPHARAILLDFCPEMLAIAQQKGVKFIDRSTFLEADAQKLPLDDHSVDAVSIAYGIRNVCSPIHCFQEVARVLKPGGHLVILELTRPHFPPLRLLHHLYLNAVLPVLGKLVAKNFAAYRYLSTSIQNFCPPDTLEHQLRQASLMPTHRYPLMGGLATIFYAKYTPSKCVSSRC